MKHTPVLVVALMAALLTLIYPSDEIRSDDNEAPRLIKPAISTETGLLLQPPLDLSDFTTQDFVAASSTIGLERIHKKWTSAVTALPEHSRADVHGLAESEVKEYMLQVRHLFDQGDAVPISDVGLISTQEDVVRQPMLNHIAAFSNSVVRVYLLVQKTAKGKNWGYFSIVQDLTVTPSLDYYGDIKGNSVKLTGTSCYKCHSSGPLAIHPARADLVSDPPLAAAISKYIADQPRSRFYFPEHSKSPELGKPLTMEFCTECHDPQGDRNPLFQVHSHPIRVLVDFGYMPPNRRLNANEIAELKAWLDDKK